MTDVRGALRAFMVALYLAAGLLHVVYPDALLPIVPEWVPWPRQVVVATGICEIAGALGLLTVRLRVQAGIMLAIYALCVWPANFKQAFGHVILPPIPDSWWYHGPRLVLQPVLIWCALYCSGASNWPFAERS